MKVFVSYSREDSPLAERINGALNAAGFDTFLDTKKLPPGQEFNARIKAAVEDSDAFIFLISQDSVNPGSYTLTELAFAEAKWRNPAGYVLPVVKDNFDPGNLPTYLRPINALIIRGNLEAEVVGWVEERAAGNGGGSMGLTSVERFKKWARLSQPPIREVSRRIPNASKFMIMAAIVFAFIFSFSLFGLLVGGGMLIYGVFIAIRVLRGDIKTFAVIVLDKEYGENGFVSIVHVLTVDDKRLRLSPDNTTARNVYPGEFGWVYVSGDLLLDFITGSPASKGNSQVSDAHVNE